MPATEPKFLSVLACEGRVIIAIINRGIIIYIIDRGMERCIW